MKKFIFGFIIGLIIIFFAGKVWDFMPDYLGGHGGFIESVVNNPFVACRDLDKTGKNRGNVEVQILKDNKPEVNLEVDLSIVKPPAIVHPRFPGEFSIAEKLCAQSTNAKGIALFKDVPAGAAYIFFNNDVANYIKRYGSPNYEIATAEVTPDKTVSTVIKLP